MRSEKISYSNWLKNKKENDYWKLKNVPYDYHRRARKTFFKKLHNNDLECRQVNWFVTNKCDLACHHCGVSANERNFSEISIDQFSRIIPNLKKIGTKLITLSGGEPLLRKDIKDIIKLLKDSGFKVGMVSNASKMKDFSNFMKKTGYKIDSLTISIDGLEKNHSQIRKNSNNFKKAISGISLAKEAGVEIVSVNTCVYPYNINDLEELKKVIFEQGVDQWSLRPISPSGRASNINNYYLSYQQIKELLLYVKENLINGYDIVVGAELGYLGKLDSYINLSPYFCSIGWNTMTILPNGDIKGFDEAHLPYEGNILKDNIETIWENGFEYYRYPNIPKYCFECQYYKPCNGGHIPGAEMGRRCIKPVLEIL